ncbi:DUF6694 family lipoprotein [Alloalcanivorax xenomutans]|uniref:Uncharacterized protein n=1 Tax=Alloalcanivorax balearicus MACL04 TaxID=1177182 RepID=A0ABT2QVM2_9GAMM|nr:DUF6694 family lipoprotein [Alloalcanivorax xenomutans]MCE7525428.1 hypothetical protein [Alloalcanivorax xenomutans]MCU5781578.1 hypothetical protein [Alloalcanivorax balearicus MACL04]
MRLIWILCVLTLLSGCFDPTLDISTRESRKTSYLALLNSLPEDQQEEFDALVIKYLEEYEIGGHVYVNDLEDLHGLTAAEILEVTKEHKARIDSIVAEEMAAHQEYQDYKAQNPDKFKPSNYMKVSRHYEPEYFSGYRSELKFVNILSLVDELEIKELTVNRGNCRIYRVMEGPGGSLRHPLPKKIKYGETLKIQVDHQCNIIEAQIVTDHGSGTYTFDG